MPSCSLKILNLESQQQKPHLYSGLVSKMSCSCFFVQQLVAKANFTGAIQSVKKPKTMAKGITTFNGIILGSELT
jgi:hypothetical protein